jgi:predicted transcriptional regulator
MPRPHHPSLTDGELRLMNVIWNRGAATVREIQERLDEELSDSTVRTLLAILERKGHVRRERRGRAHVYRPVDDRATTRQTTLAGLARRFLTTPAELVLGFVKSGELTRAELERIAQAIEERREDEG